MYLEAYLTYMIKTFDRVLNKPLLIPSSLFEHDLTLFS